jgi:hypothetical protein
MMALTAPTAGELLQNPVVMQELAQAWSDSLPNDANRRHEEGGWIYMDVSNGRISVEHAIPGGQYEIDLDHPIIVLMSVIVGKYHMHPNPSHEGWDPRPSQQDYILDWRDGVPNLVVSDQGTFVSGPSSHRNGLAGPGAYPL